MCILQYKGNFAYQYQSDYSMQEKLQPAEPAKSPATTSETSQDKKVRYCMCSCYNAKWSYR